MDNWKDRDITEILDETDRLYYQNEKRQLPKLTRKEAAAAEREERRMQFYTWCMIDRFGEFNFFAYHD